MRDQCSTFPSYFRTNYLCITLMSTAVAESVVEVFGLCPARLTITFLSLADVRPVPRPVVPDGKRSFTLMSTAWQKVSILPNV